MSDLLAEVDEIMRQERLAKLWKEHSAIILTLIIGTIVLTGALSVYKSWNASVQAEQTAALIALQESSDYPQNILETEKLKMRASLRGITLLGAANTFLKQDKRSEALALYQRAANDNAIPGDFQDLANIMVVRLSIDDKNANADALLSKLKPIWGNPKNPWGPHARIEASVIESHLNGDFTKAQSHLKAVLETTNLPESLYNKARALGHVYGLQNNKKQQDKDNE